MLTPLVEVLGRPLDGFTAYLGFHGDPYSFFLDSSMEHDKLGRYSFIGSDPFLVFKAKGSNCKIIGAKGEHKLVANPFNFLQQLCRQFKVEGKFLPPLPGGVVGYFAYDMGRQLEKLPDKASDDLNLPDCCVCFYDSIVTIDHQEGETFLVSTGHPFTGKEKEKRANRRLQGLKKKVINKGYRVLKSDNVAGMAHSFRSNFSKAKYLEMVNRAKEYIAAGDIYQVNLSQRLETRLLLPPLILYKRLRNINPAPFASYLDFKEVVVASSSPERFLKLTGKQVQTRPIKGTRPRGDDPARDEVLRQELYNSEKDRAELLMIVDLERNDLGRVCKIGSIKVPELFCLETYATVYHLVSTVTGILPEDKDIFDVLQASFPGGSITGAPKIRAMEIIEELEPVKRSIYTGSIGYIGFDGDADLNIVIRTFLIKKDRAYFQVGGGIVADSDPASEYQETLDKARALISALGITD